MNPKELVRKVSAALGYSIHRAGVIETILLDLESLKSECKELSDANALMKVQRDEALVDLEKNASTIERLTREVKIRHAISVAIGRYFSRGLRTTEVYIPIAQVKVDSMVEWVPELLNRSELSEPEFTIFRFFRDPSETILDIGANYGYSATSIFATGSQVAVLSFEPNPWHFPCLQAIKDLRTGRFDFLGVALGASEGSVAFTMPVVDGIGNSALSSADIRNQLDWTIPENLVIDALGKSSGADVPRIQFTEFSCPLTTLDNVMSRNELAISTEQIAAIKLDVEGFEAEVIAGAKNTLSRHRPLLLVEGANRNQTVAAQLADLGFRFGELHGDRIKLLDAISQRVGGFYLHESRLREYADKGFLA